MKTENVAESHQTDIPYTFPAGHETRPGPPRFTVLSSDGKLGVGLGTRLSHTHATPTSAVYKVI